MRGDKVAVIIQNVGKFIIAVESAVAQKHVHGNAALLDIYNAIADADLKAWRVPPPNPERGKAYVELSAEATAMIARYGIKERAERQITQGEGGSRHAVR